MEANAIEIPAFLKAQLQTFAGLTVATTTLNLVFENQIIQAYYDSLRDDEFQRLVSLHGGLSEFLLYTHANIISNEPIIIKDRLEDYLTAGYEQTSAEAVHVLIKTLLTAFDALIENGMISAHLKEEMFVFNGLRNSLIEIVVSYYA